MARILVAEDDEIVADIIFSALMDAGYSVGILRNGCDALAAIRAKRPDLVILDGDLPGMHGVEVLSKLRLEPGLWPIPVLFLTASRSRSDEDIAMLGGARGYLRKPFDPEYVVFRVEEELKAAGERHAASNASSQSYRIC